MRNRHAPLVSSTVRRPDPSFGYSPEQAGSASHAAHVAGPITSLRPCATVRKSTVNDKEMQAYLMKNFDAVNEDDEGVSGNRQMSFIVEDSPDVESGGGSLRERASKLIAVDFVPPNLTDASLEVALGVALSIEKNDWCAPHGRRPAAARASARGTSRPSYMNPPPESTHSA